MCSLLSNGEKGNLLILKVHGGVTANDIRQKVREHPIRHGSKGYINSDNGSD